MMGLLLIIIGIIFLLKNLGVITVGTWEVIWPVFLIVAGLGFLVRKYTPGGYPGFFLAPLESCFFCGKKKRDTDRYE